MREISCIQFLTPALWEIIGKNVGNHWESSLWLNLRNKSIRLGTYVGNVSGTLNTFNYQ